MKCQGLFAVINIRSFLEKLDDGKIYTKIFTSRNNKSKRLLIPVSRGKLCSQDAKSKKREQKVVEKKKLTQKLTFFSQM